MIFSSFEAMNPSRRNTMEDRHSIFPAGTWKAPDDTMTYLAIYDGHGGRDMVDFLEHAMPFHVAQELENDSTPQNDASSPASTDNDDNDQVVSMETRMERAFLMADLHGRQCGIMASGATVAICLVKPLPTTNEIQFTAANAGDARVVLGQAGQPAERLSFDHRVDDPHEVQRIVDAGGFCWKNRVMGVLAVTRALGDQRLKEFVIAEPFVKQVTIPLLNTTQSTSTTTATSADESFVILACDGLFDVMSDQEAVDIVRTFDGEKTHVAERLVQEGIRRGTADNLTVIVAWP